MIHTSKGEQVLSIEDMVSKVTYSRGVLEPASESCLPEAAIVCGMARATLPESKTPWADFAEDYALIRDKIAEVFPDIYWDFNARLENPEGFHLDVAPRRRVWRTPNGKANFLLLPGLLANEPVADDMMLRLATVRSHDQFNTTIYSYNDRYRGVRGNRMVLFMNVEDRQARGLQNQQIIALETIGTDGVKRRVDGLTVLDYPISRGAVAGYYPELNPLLPLYYRDRIAETPAAKSIPVRVVA